jgi:23S rRNA pseudouridine1911/1915/1917 synthase
MKACSKLDAVQILKENGCVDRPPLEILYEDNHCIAISKPAGELSTHYQGKEETLDRDIKRYLKEKYQKPGNVYLGVVHRLDRLVSGVLLFARTTKAAGRIAKQFRDGTAKKKYWAVIDGYLPHMEGTLDDWLFKDDHAGRVRVVAPHTPGSRHCVLHYRPLGGGKLVGRHVSFLEIDLQTGRRHQIRAQLAHRGFLIYGDRKYGSRQSFGKAIALHARSLTFIHPTRGEPITLVAQLPPAWRSHFGPQFAEINK